MTTQPRFSAQASPPPATDHHINLFSFSTFDPPPFQQGLYGTATQLVSCAPTQELHGDTAVEAAPLPWPQPHSYLPARPPRPAVQLQQQPAWGLCHDEATFWRDVDGEQLVETESRQTTPGASRAASPGPLLPCTAPQQAAADLAAFISQQLGEGSPLLGSEEIRRHYPRAQARGRGLAWFSISGDTVQECAWAGNPSCIECALAAAHASGLADSNLSVECPFAGAVPAVPRMHGGAAAVPATPAGVFQAQPAARSGSAGTVSLLSVSAWWRTPWLAVSA